MASGYTLFLAARVNYLFGEHVWATTCDTMLSVGVPTGIQFVISAACLYFIYVKVLACFGLTPLCLSVHTKSNLGCLAADRTGRCREEGEEARTEEDELMLPWGPCGGGDLHVFKRYSNARGTVPWMVGAGAGGFALTCDARRAASVGRGTDIEGNPRRV